MKKIIDNFRTGRHEFENGHLENIHDLKPFDLFEEWMTEAVKVNEKEPNAFVMSTINEKSEPKSRIVYLKDIIDGEFVLYTNYESDKGKEIANNPNVSMLFFWPDSSRQIRINGICTKLDEKISDAYFASRPRGSKIGAWASAQSAVLSDRKELDDKVAKLEAEFGDEIPRPAFWGGYKIKPTSFEFWQGRPSRLHDRIVFEVDGDSWKQHRINP